MDTLLTVAWVVPHADYADDDVLTLLRSQGYRIRPCLAEDANSVGAKLRVLQTRSFTEPGGLLRALLMAELPTLIVADSADEEAQMLALAGPHDEVVHGLAPVGLLLQRLQRLHQRVGQPVPDDVALRREAGTLLDRAAWSARLVQHLAQADATGCAAVVLLDVDGFRHVNARHGHEQGNAVLAQISGHLQALLTPQDALGRYGGNEFALLVRRYDATALRQEMQALLHGLNQREFRLGTGTEQMRLHVSAGLAWLPGLAEGGVDAGRFNQALSQADQALLKAKRMRDGELVLHPSEPAAAGAAASRARRGAELDPMTLVYHHTHLAARLARECPAALRQGRSLVLGLIDIDQLHSINSTHGRASGDLVLQRLTEVARASVRVVDWLARYRSATFAVVMPDTDGPGAALVARRVLQALAEAPFQSCQKRPLRISACMGLAGLSPGCADAPSLLAAAEGALLAAKSRGPGQLHTLD